jgi:predicted RNase H-like HicB family nuclease
MARTHSLKVVLRSGEDGWIVAECPALAGCISQGRNRDEALANVREAIELCLEAGETPRDGELEVTVVEVDAA